MNDRGFLGRILDRLQDKRSVLLRMVDCGLFDAHAYVRIFGGERVRSINYYIVSYDNKYHIIRVDEEIDYTENMISTKTWYIGEYDTIEDAATTINELIEKYINIVKKTFKHAKMEYRSLRI